MGERFPGRVYVTIDRYFVGWEAKGSNCRSIPCVVTSFDTTTDAIISRKRRKTIWQRKTNNRRQNLYLQLDCCWYVALIKYSSFWGIGSNTLVALSLHTCYILLMEYKLYIYTHGSQHKTIYIHGSQYKLYMIGS